MSAEKHEIGAWLKRVRQERGWTQMQLAARVGLGQAAIYQIESGGQHLRFVQAVLMSQVLGFSLDELAALVVPPPCSTCDEKPPVGFQCNTCGLRGGAA